MANEDFPSIEQFDVARQQLARRRRIAESLMAQRAPVSKMQGDYAILAAPGDTMAAGIDRAFGNFDNNRIDQAELANNLAARDASDSILSNIPTSGPERQQAQIKAMGNPSLRAQIQAMMGVDEAEANRQFKQQEAEAARLEKSEQEAANRVLKSEEGELNRGLRSDLAFETNSLRREIARNSGGGSKTPEDIELDRDLKKERLKQLREGKPDPKASQAEADNKAVLKTIEQASPLIGVATGSGVGAVYDKAAALIGQSSTSADAAAQLASLGGFLVSKMPKMSGPQSDKDVQLYKEMAGRIGDPTVPASQKKAALDTIRRFHERAGTAPAGPISVTNDADYAKVPSGAEYKTPDGKTRRKP